MNRTAVRRMLVPLAMLALTACSGLSSKDPPVQTYVLQAGAAALPVAVRPAVAAAGEMPGDGAGTLAIARPTAAAGLDNEHIALVRTEGRLDYYSASRWAGNLPDVLQTLLIETHRASGRYRAVLADNAAFGSDQLLEVEVRRFEAEYGVNGPPTAHVVLEATLGTRSQRQVLRTLRAESRVTAGADRMGSVVAAFNQALDEALRQLVADPAR